MRLATLGWGALLVVSTAWLAWSAARLYPSQPGIDLYHPWGIAIVRAEGKAQRNPYADPRAYGALLLEASAGAQGESLRIARSIWAQRSGAKIEPTATPFFYASLGFLPRDYDTARHLFAIAQLAAFLGAVFLLARLRAVPALPAACIAVILAATFNPFIQDMKVANVSSLQLAFIAAMVWIAMRRLDDRHPAFDRLYLAGLALFVVLKPSTLVIAAALAVHYGVVRGPRRFALGLAFAATAALGAIALGMAYFHDAGVWTDWWRYMNETDGGALTYPLDSGNHSLPMLLAERTGGYGPFGYALLVAAGVSLAYVAAASDSGRRTDLVVPLTREAFADPWFAASAGVIATFAASPLLWPHYDVLLLVPMAWLARAEGKRALAAGCALASYLALCYPLLRLLIDAGLTGLAHSLLFFGWVPLLVGALGEVAARRSAIPSDEKGPESFVGPRGRRVPGADERL